MKKYWMIPLLCTLCIGMTGCGGKTLSCTKEDKSNEDLKIVDTIEAKFSKDKVSKMSTITEVKAMGAYKKHMDALKSNLEEPFTEVKDQKGITFKTSVKGQTITRRLDVNVKEMDADTLEDLGLIGAYQKYEEAKRKFEEDGYTCK